MFERYTDRARRVVILAQEEARMLNHSYIGTEHLLLGIVHEGEAVAAQALASFGVTLEAAREQVETIVGCGQEPPSGHLPFTPRMKKVLDLALREALGLGHNYLGTEHLLLGLVREGEGLALKALGDLGVPADDVRARVLELLRGYESAEAAPIAVVRYVRTAALGDVLAAVEGLGSRLAALERHLGITDSEATP